MLVERDVSIAPYTSWKAGGQVAYLLKPDSLEQLQVWLSQHASLPKMMLGLGSNVLFPDDLWLGAVILSRHFLTGFKRIDHASWQIEAGVSCAKIARAICQEGFRDAAFFCGIPGTLGGALRMNAGAYGGETWQVVDWVEVMTAAGEIRRLLRDEVSVSYRHVDVDPGDYFLRAQLSFKDHHPQSQQAQIAHWLKQRAATQPIGLPSCGSVFKNPYPDHAGALIESCGLKGFRIGGAEVSTKHANFIINVCEARAEDIRTLIALVQERVFAERGIRLETEVIFIR